jgi:hypothetical protein
MKPSSWWCELQLQDDTGKILWHVAEIFVLGAEFVSERLFSLRSPWMFCFTSYCFNSPRLRTVTPSEWSRLAGSFSGSLSYDTNGSSNCFAWLIVHYSAWF